MLLRHTFLTLVALLVFPYFVNAQAGGLHFITVRDSKSFSFPIFVGSTDRAVTRINRLLQLSELQSLAKSKTKRIFDQAKVDDGSIYGGKVGMLARIHSNRKNILSVGFEESSCGMTCTYWTRHYNFNPRNGDRIAVHDLFTEKGYARFKEFVVDQRSSKYRREVSLKVNPEFREAYLDTLPCLENDDLEDFYISGRTIVIDGENCLIKSQKFDGLDMSVRFPLRGFRQYLNQFGRGVFNLDKADLAAFRSNDLPQVFEGTIGSIPIVMVLNQGIENGIRGVYVYLKYGEGLGLDGSLIDGAAAIKEFSLSPTTEVKVYGPVRKYFETGHISATLDEGRIEGTWSNKDGTVTLPLFASSR